jgi:hypothetical protein
LKDAQTAIHDGFHHSEVGKDKVLKLAIQNKTLGKKIVLWKPLDICQEALMRYSLLWLIVFLR